jgi:hypothetical protein
MVRAGDKIEYVVKLDEAFFILITAMERKIYYIKSGDNTPVDWVFQCEKYFPKGFMVVAGMSCIIPLIKIPPKSKVKTVLYLLCSEASH